MRTRGVSKDRRGKGLSAWGLSSIVDPMAFWRVSFSLFAVILKSRLMEIGAGSVSLRKKKVTRQAIRENVAEIAQGRK